MKKLFTVLPLVLATSAAMAYEQDKTYQFTILHTNDTHGHFWPNAKGEYGFPAHKTIVNRVKAEVEQKGGSLILLNAGEVTTSLIIHYKFLICKKNGQTSHSYLQT